MKLWLWRAAFFGALWLAFWTSFHPLPVPAFVQALIFAGLGYNLGHRAFPKAHL